MARIILKDIKDLLICKSEYNAVSHEISDTNELLRSEENLNEFTNITLESLLERKSKRTKCILSLYKEPPKGDCDMLSKKEWIPPLIQRLIKENLVDFQQIILDNFPENSPTDHFLKLDVNSHYIMRLACSRLYESLRWFIKQEVKLFQIRWFLLNETQRKDFLNRCKIILNSVSPEERIELFTKFRDMRIINNLFKTRFYRASQLMKTRRVYLLNGWVYYKIDQAVYPILNQFEKYLDTSLIRAKKKYNYVHFDVRYSYFLHRISDEIKNSLFRYNSTEKSFVSTDDLDELSLTSYPLCMSILHHYLKRDNHLRNGGRFQYNLFLKGIGVNLFDSINFWRNIFIKKMSDKQFTQRYLYSIQHNYGKLGKLADYPPLNCSKILDFDLGPLDHHGCPFKNCDEKSLLNHLKRVGLSEESIIDIQGKVKNNMPRHACARMFELTHGVTEEKATSHPNVYFHKSQKLKNKHLEPICGQCRENSNPTTSKLCQEKNKQIDW